MIMEESKISSHNDGDNHCKNLGIGINSPPEPAKDKDPPRFLLPIIEEA